MEICFFNFVYFCGVSSSVAYFPELLFVGFDMFLWSIFYNFFVYCYCLFSCLMFIYFYSFLYLRDDYFLVCFIGFDFLGYLIVFFGVLEAFVLVVCFLGI